MEAGSADAVFNGKVFRRFFLKGLKNQMKSIVSSDSNKNVNNSIKKSPVCLLW